MALGVGNVVAPLFGGIAATGAKHAGLFTRKDIAAALELAATLAQPSVAPDRTPGRISEAPR